MSKRFEIHEIRTLTYTVEVPDSVTAEELERAGLDSEMFSDEYGGQVASWSDLCQYSVHPVESDDDEYWSVVLLDENLEEVETLEEAEIGGGQELEPTATDTPHGSTKRGGPMMANLMWAEDPEGNYCLGHAGHVFGYLFPCQIFDSNGHEFVAIDPALQHFDQAVWATREQAVSQISFDCICQGHVVESDAE